MKKGSLISIRNQKNIIAILFSISAILALNPYIGWGFKYFPVVGPIIAISAFFIAFALGKIVISPSNLLIFFISLFIASYLNLSDVRTVLVNLVFYIPLFTFIFIAQELKNTTIHFFIIIFSLTLIPAIILFLFNGIGIDFPWKHLEPANTIKLESGLFYKQYFGAIIINNADFPYRLSAMYDEPGVVGTISALILTAKGFNVKKHLALKIILFGGLLSFSLFFYISVVVYFFLSILLQKRYRRIIIIIIIFTTYMLFEQEIFYNEFINERIIARLQIEDGSLIGNNRTNSEFEIFFDNFMNSSFEKKLFGLGRNYTATDESLYSAASWKKLVIERGFLSLILVISFYLITFLLNIKKNINTSNTIIYFLILILCIYQRPGVFDLPFYIIFISSLYSKDMKKQMEGVQYIGKQTISTIN